MEEEPSKWSIDFISRLNWKELVPYMKKIYGEHYTENFLKYLSKN